MARRVPSVRPALPTDLRAGRVEGVLRLREGDLSNVVRANSRLTAVGVLLANNIALRSSLWRTLLPLKM